jgi:hypothetical protein
MVQSAIHAGDNMGALCFSLLTANYAARAGAQDPVAPGYIGYALSSLGFLRLAASYFVSEPSETDWRGRTYAILKASHLLQIGDLAGAEATVKRDAEVSRRSGFHTALAYHDLLQGYIEFFRGRLGLSEALFRRALSVEGTRHVMRHALPLPLVFLGHLDTAVPLAVEACDEASPPPTRSVGFATLALLRARGDDLEGALDAIARAMAVKTSHAMLGYPGVAFFAGLLETRLGDLERARCAPDGQRALAECTVAARRALRLSETWSKRSTIGHAQTSLYRGKLEAILGNTARAKASFEQSLALAEGMQLSLCAALARLELGRAAANAEERRVQLELARPALELAGATPFVEHVDSLLGEGKPRLAI